MCSERIILYSASPVIVYHTRTRFFGTDTVTPVIFIGETASGPAQYGDMQLTESSEDIIAVSLCVGDRRVFSDPDTAIDTCAEMLGKLSVDFFIDFWGVGIRSETDSHFFCCGKSRKTYARCGDK